MEKNLTWKTEKDLFASSTLIATNAKTESNYYQEYYRLDPCTVQRLRDYPVGVDTAKFGIEVEPETLTQFQIRYQLNHPVIQVGRIEPHKNQLATIKALFDTQDEIVLLGKRATHSTDYVDECYELAQQRGNVRFIEWLPEDELPLFYASGSVHVLPSWWDLPGLVSLEAAAMGCKVVSTCEGSAYDYLGDEAWYCRPDDLLSIRQAVQMALAAPNTVNLRERVLKSYTWQHSATAVNAIYREALSLH
jgi:glycosyltransferase involved in cell wall biosynthesis